MGLVVKRFTASWCGPCRTLAPIMVGIQIQNPGVQFEIIDVDDNEKLAIQYGIRSVPTVILEKNGEIVETILGAKPEQAYKTAISTWK